MEYECYFQVDTKLKKNVKEKASKAYWKKVFE